MSWSRDMGNIGWKKPRAPKPGEGTNSWSAIDQQSTANDAMMVQNSKTSDHDHIGSAAAQAHQTDQAYQNMVQSYNQMSCSSIQESGISAKDCDLLTETEPIMFKMLHLIRLISGTEVGIKLQDKLYAEIKDLYQRARRDYTQPSMYGYGSAEQMLHSIQRETFIETFTDPLDSLENQLTSMRMVSSKAELMDQVARLKSMTQQALHAIEQWETATHAASASKSAW